MGAAFLAGLATGFWSSIDDIKDLWEEDQRFVPAADKQIQETISLWKNRISSILTI